MTFFTSDLHFAHKNIVKYSNRPWTIEDQTEEMISRWNSRVGEMDKVYHLGDFYFGGSKALPKVLDIIKRLNGQITFVRGNHCETNLWKLIEDANLPHVLEITHYKEISISGQKVILCHYPFETWNLSHHGSIHLHGHCHGSLPSRGKRLDVGIDNHPDHQVFTWEEIQEYMLNRHIEVVDHHNGERP